MSSSFPDPRFPPQPGPSQPVYGLAEPVYEAQPLPSFAPPPPSLPKKKSGCGCLGCFLGCLGMTVVCLLVLGVGVYYGLKALPDIVRDAVRDGVQQSDLPEEDKKMVMEQVDRLVAGVKDGRVGFQQAQRFAEEFSQSPFLPLLVAFAAKVKYIDAADLPPEEKQAAERTLQRVARGVVEKKIEGSDIEAALDHISTKDPNGARNFKETVTDDELRAFLTDCKQLADTAEVPDEEFRVDVGAELKKLVDSALGIPPEPELPAFPEPPAGLIPLDGKE